MDNILDSALCSRKPWIVFKLLPRCHISTLADLQNSSEISTISLYSTHIILILYVFEVAALSVDTFQIFLSSLLCENTVISHVMFVSLIFFTVIHISLFSLHSFWKFSVHPHLSLLVCIQSFVMTFMSL